MRGAKFLLSYFSNFKFLCQITYYLHDSIVCMCVCLCICVCVCVCVCVGGWVGVVGLVGKFSLKNEGCKIFLRNEGSEIYAQTNEGFKNSTQEIAGSKFFLHLSKRTLCAPIPHQNVRPLRLWPLYRSRVTTFLFRCVIPTYAALLPYFFRLRKFPLPPS